MAFVRGGTQGGSGGGVRQRGCVAAVLDVGLQFVDAVAGEGAVFAFLAGVVVPLVGVKSTDDRCRVVAVWAGVLVFDGVGLFRVYSHVRQVVRSALGGLSANLAYQGCGVDARLDGVASCVC